MIHCILLEDLNKRQRAGSIIELNNGIYNTLYKRGKVIGYDYSLGEPIIKNELEELKLKNVQLLSACQNYQKELTTFKKIRDELGSVKDPYYTILNLQKEITMLTEKNIQLSTKIAEIEEINKEPNKEDNVNNIPLKRKYQKKVVRDIENKNISEEIQ